MACLTLSFLGVFQVTLDGTIVARFGTDKTRALLAYLALESERAHPRPALAGMLWPDLADDAARHSLRQTLLRLRGALGQAASAQFLLATPETLAFNRAGDYALDVDDFTARVHACQRHTHSALNECAACSARLRRAVELYRGELLADLFIGESAPFEEWVLVRRELAHRQMLESLDALTAYHTARGEYARARDYAARQIELEPWREEGHRALMHAFALEGQRGAALAQYDICRKILAREFNAAPSEETTQLHQKIRAGAVASAHPAAPFDAADNVDALAALAQFHIAQGDLARAHATQVQVVAQRQESGDRHALALAHQHLGTILCRQENFALALAHFRAALALREQIGDQPGIAASLEAQAQVLGRQGDRRAARADFCRALKIAERLGDPMVCARVLTHLGALDQRDQKIAAARACFQRALEIYTRIGNRAAMIDLQNRLDARRDPN